VRPPTPFLFTTAALGSLATCFALTRDSYETNKAQAAMVSTDNGDGGRRCPTCDGRLRLGCCRHSGAFDSSTMKNAHFRLHGTFIVKRNYFPLTGDGVLQLAPREAVAMTFRIQTYSSQGVLKFQVVTIGGRAYLRVGSGRWTSKPSTGSMVTITSYVGEEIMSGTAVWHVRSVSVGDTNDIWIREADAYIVQLVDVGTSGTMTMDFDSYNKSRAIAKP
jgi:hypothetical protein